MTVIAKDQIEGGRISETSAGFTTTRTFTLSGVSGTGSAMLFNALNDSNVPQYGEPHPVIPDIQVTQRTADPLDDGIISIEITYSLPDESEEFERGTAEPTAEQATINIGTGISSEETNFDIDGNPLIVDYTGTITDSEGNETDVTNDEQVATVNVERPQTVVAFSRRESRTPFLLRDFTGKTNRRGVGGFDTGSLLCTRIDGQSDDGGRTYSVNYEFQFDPDGWTKDISWIDPETDRPPSDVSASNGKATVTVYDDIDFDRLNLPF